MTPTERHLAIVMALQEAGWQRAADLGAALGVSARTVYRDVEALVEAGVPVVGVPGRGYRLSETYFLPALRLTTDEAMLLRLALDATDAPPDTPLQAAAASAREKLDALLPERLRTEVAARQQQLRFEPANVFDDAAARQVQAALREAWQARRAVQLGFTCTVGVIHDGSGRLKAKTLGHVDLPCDDVILAIGQENAFPWVERDIGIEFDQWDVPVVDDVTFESTLPGVFFGGDAAFGPKNIIWAVEHGHQAAISIDKYCHGLPMTERLAHGMNLTSTKMSIHEWSYSNDFDVAERRLMPHVDLKSRFSNLDIEVELGFTDEQTATEVERCLNCDIQTVFKAPLCIECDACIDICPVDCLTIAANGDEDDLRTRLTAPAENLDQPLYVSDVLPQTGRVMVKDENLCVHCGLCAERCPTAAWDMQKSELIIPYATDEAEWQKKRKAG